MSPSEVLRQATGTNAIPGFGTPITIIIWIRLVMALLLPWTSESQAIWAVLLGYRVDRAYLCKNRSGNEHEFMVFDLIDEGRQDPLRLLVERSAGGRRDDRSRSPSPELTPVFTAEPDHFVHGSPLPGSPHNGRRSSSPTPPVKGGITKATDSFHRMVRRWSDGPLSRSSGIISNGYLAADTVVRINSFPPKARIVRSVEFSSTPHSQGPSLWDLMILAYVIHRDSCVYELLDRQCFWFADSICAILEKWSGICGGVPVTIDAPSGCVKGVVFHRRKPEQVDEIWAQFTEQKDKMNKELRGYEDKRQEEVAITEELKKQVGELKKQQERERQERETEMRERSETELQLKNAQEQRERQLMQCIKDQQRQLEDKDREWEIFLLQRERKGDRLSQELVRGRIGMASSSSSTHLDPQVASSCPP